MKEPRAPQADDIQMVLTWLADVRALAIINNVDPWALRQALVTVLEVDTLTLVEKGLSREGLERFDMVARREARKWIREATA